jgi:hypothetical protein
MIRLYTAVTAAMSNSIYGESFDQLVVKGGFKKHGTEFGVQLYIYWVD